jgi:hypothetical protein
MLVERYSHPWEISLPREHKFHMNMMQTAVTGSRLERAERLGATDMPICMLFLLRMKQVSQHTSDI